VKWHELPEPSQLLPPTAVRQLREAVQTPIPRGDMLARVKAIEQATERIQRQYPQFFKR